MATDTALTTTFSTDRYLRCIYYMWRFGSCSTAICWYNDNQLSEDRRRVTSRNVIHTILSVTEMETLPFEKLTLVQLVRKFCAFYGTSKVNYGTHNSLPLISILRYLKPTHTLTPYLLKPFNTILPLTFSSPEGQFLL
jgi:hypothetical protein